ncbi:MAG: toxic anion resistance protein, partial [Erythrobacter sp.]|nr:toxic anion resistance protein [Erythrobacter sp.]
MSTETTTATATPFSLTPPDPVPQVAPEQAVGLVPVTTEQKSKLDTKVDAFVDELVQVDANSPQFGEKVDQITRMGQEQIRAAAAMSNRFLDRPVRAMDADGSVGKDLAELRRTVEDLDPGRKGKISGPRKILGFIPFGNKLKNYFDSYTSAQGHIAAILQRLESGKKELHLDNAAIDTERQKL